MTTTDYIDSLEEFLHQVLPLKKKIILYGFGMHGRQVKSILNSIFNIQESMIVDDELASMYPGIQATDDLAQMNLKETVVLVTGAQEDCQEEKLANLYRRVSKEKCFILLRENFKQEQKIQKRQHQKRLEVLKKVEQVKLEENGMVYKPEHTNSMFFLPYIYMDYIQQIVFLTEDYYEMALLKRVFFDFKGGILKDYIRQGCILDIGANIGNHTLYFANELKAKQILSFEPVYETYRILEKNVKLNQLEKSVKTYCLALSDKKGTGFIDGYDFGNIGSTTLQDGEGDISFGTVDELGLWQKGQEVRFMKIDVEGMEIQVLRGAEATIDKCHPYIMLESWAHQFQEVKSFLWQHGYDYEQLNENYYLFYPLESGQAISVGQRKISWKYNRDKWVRVRCLDPYNGVLRKVLIQYADDILHGVLWPARNLGGYPYTEETLDWNMVFPESSNTCQLYMQGLSPCGCLAMAYQQTRKLDYLACAKRLFYSWYQYRHSGAGNLNTYFFSDHSVALRAYFLQTLTLFIEGTRLDTDEFRFKVQEILLECAEWLYNDNHYNHNHNHGIMQDTVLLLLGCFLDHSQSSSWIKHALERLDGQWKYAYTEEFVHVENSPGYAVGVTSNFFDLTQILMKFEALWEERNRFSGYLHLIGEHLAWLTMPNGASPMLGDTYYIPKNRPTLEFLEYKNARLNFATSLGEYDMMLPEAKEEHTKCYPQSGYWFYREHWESGMEATWKMLRAGYVSKTHKHADDLSFLLYSKGYQIFIDTGMYNYMIGEPFRDYFISAPAHNTITVDERSYSPTVENAWKTGIISQQTTDSMDYVLAFNDMYDGVEIDRHLYSSGDLTILYDDIVSEQEHRYQQLFHLSSDLRKMASSSEEVLLQIGDTDYKVRLRQIISAKLTEFRGRKETQPLYGHKSEKINSVEEIDTLRYEMQTDCGRFVTIVTIEDTEGMVRLKDGTRIKAAEIIWHKENVISYGEDSIYLASRKRVYPKGRAFIEDGNILLVKAEPQENCQYALYVVSVKDGCLLYKTGYGKNRLFLYDLHDLGENSGDLFVRLYARSITTGERKHSIIAALVCGDTGNYQVDGGAKYQQLNLKYQGHHMEQIGQNKYRFVVDCICSLPMTIKWYVYKNGAYCTSRSTTERSVEVDFKEPGEYCVCYYVQTVNSDNLFWNFPAMTIQ